MENLENNLLIAEFMGIKPTQISSSLWGLSNMPFWSVIGNTPEKVMQDAADKFGFDTDWNKLMAVVIQINSTDDIKYNNSGTYKVTIGSDYVWIDQPIGDRIYFSGNDFTDRENPLFEKVYNGVVKFIKWYNNQKGEGNV